MLAENLRLGFTEGFDTADLKDAKALLQRTRRPTAVTCSKCRTENASGAKFCVECGESVKGRCPNCGLANPAKRQVLSGMRYLLPSVKSRKRKQPVGDGTMDIRISSQHAVGEIPEG